MHRLAILLMAAAGCAPVHRLEAAAPEERSLRLLLDGLRDADPTRRAASRQLLEDLGPAAAPTLRALLTRRDAPADPSVFELIRSLRAEETTRRRAALDQLLLRGSTVQADLWEMIFTTQSSELLLLCVELLALADGDGPPASVVVELLAKWSALPSIPSTPERPPATVAPVRIADGERRYPRPADDYSMRQAMREKDDQFLIIYFPVQREEREPEDYQQKR